MWDIFLLLPLSVISLTPDIHWPVCWCTLSHHIPHQELLWSGTKASSVAQAFCVVNLHTPINSHSFWNVDTPGTHGRILTWPERNTFLSLCSLSLFNHLLHERHPKRHHKEAVDSTYLPATDPVAKVSTDFTLTSTKPSFLNHWLTYGQAEAVISSVSCITPPHLASLDLMRMPVWETTLIISCTWWWWWWWLTGWRLISAWVVMVVVVVKVMVVDWDFGWRFVSGLLVVVLVVGS